MSSYFPSASHLANLNQSHVSQESQINSDGSGQLLDMEALTPSNSMLCYIEDHIFASIEGRATSSTAAYDPMPRCLLKEKDSGDVNFLESSTVLGALELPRIKLSDHIERRLSVRLEDERLQREKASGKGLEEVLRMWTSNHGRTCFHGLELFCFSMSACQECQ